jgi:DNA polymerase-3 subunit alpha
MTQTYVPLRIHSPYSIAEGAMKLDALASKLDEWNVPAAGIADTQSIAGAYSIRATMTKAGIQPLMGVQIEVSHAGLDGRDEKSELVLFATSEAGYEQICRLLSSSLSSSSPVPLKDILKPDHSEDFLVLTGGIRGPIDKAVAAGAPDRARQRLKSLHNFLGSRLYVEIMRQGGVKAEDKDLTEMAKSLGIPCVATSEAWFLDPDYAEAHDALLCISQGMTLDHDPRPHSDPNGYMKSPDAMHSLFSDCPEALENTLEIARRCSFMIEEKTPVLPAFPTKDGRTEAEELRHQSTEGLSARLKLIGLDDESASYRDEFTRKDYMDRLDYELGVIEGMGFPGYFLIVADFIAWSKANDIPVGPGRGSGAGSVVAWALTITDLDPLRYGLYFERFLNPERVSMPDFDIDFCNARRDDVIDYVRGKYGNDRVAQIGTLGKLQARAVVRDVSRVLQIPFPIVDRFVKMIPNNPAHPVTLGEAMVMEPLATELASADENIKKAFELGIKLEGFYRNQSTHAAGVVIGNKPIQEIVPTYKDKHGTMVTSFDMKSVEKAGLVKFDFLGLKTLDVIKATVEISERAGEPVNLQADDTLDPETYKMLRAGEAYGVFQLESPGMRKAMLQIQPKEIEDIIALVALYRPGPMENIPHYAAVNAGDAEPDYLHPGMEETLAETKGIIVYQEQVMKLAQDLAGYTLGGADMLRRAMGKKIKSEMDAQRDVFQKGAEERGISADVASEIFDLIAKFANYGFNKSHAAAYAVISYQTAYLRQHHKEAFLSASMNIDISEVEKIAEALENIRRSNISYLPPDVNASAALFDIERIDGSPAIRHGLAALRGVGVSMAQSVIDDRDQNGPFASLQGFVTRTKPSINKRLIESLIAAGAMDAFSLNRNAMMQAVPTLMADAGHRNDEAQRGQMTMFDFIDAPIEETLPDVDDWSEPERLHRQYKVVGFYIDGHPIEAARETLNKHRGACRVVDILNGEDWLPKAISLGGVIVESIFKRTAKKDALLILKVSDETGMIEIVAFKDKADLVRDRLGKIDGRAARFEIELSMRNGEPSLFLSDLEPLKLELF